jgi:hypothetical protein
MRDARLWYTQENGSIVGFFNIIPEKQEDKQQIQ